MNLNVVQAIVRKDLKVVFQNKGVSVPLIVAPLVILVGLPAMAALVPTLGDSMAQELAQVDSLLQWMPGLQAGLAGYDQAQKMVVFLLVYFVAPFYLLLPLTTAITIASDSFAGEKERKTLEALLYTPTTDWELFVAKLLSPWLAALAVAWGGFIVYAVMSNLAAWPVMGRLFFPTTTSLILAIWVAPAAAGLGLGVTVLFSSRARTFQAAYQLAGMVILPILLVLVAQVAAVMYFGIWPGALLGLVVWAIDAALLWFGRRTFRRTRLATEI